MSDWFAEYIERKKLAALEHLREESEKDGDTTRVYDISRDIHISREKINRSR